MLPVKSSNVKADGNAEVVAMFKRWHERAEHGRLAFAIVVACENPIHAVSDHAGALQLAMAGNWGLDTAKHQLLAKVHSRHMEPFPVDPNANADRVCYDVTKGPACFDFIAWLIIAEMNRRRAGAPAPLKIAFKMNDTPEEHEKHAKLRAAFYEGVIMPSLALIGAVEDNNSADAPTLERYTIGPVVEFAKAGEEVPLLVPSKESVAAIREYLGADDYKLIDPVRPVTITLREAPYWEYRNSNLTEWLKVAEYLENQGERVIFIRDTAKWDEPITGFETCPAASLDLHTRLALYESAKCNLAVSNGPWMLMLHGSRPWLMFVEPNGMSPFFPETPQFWTQWHGINPILDEQFPWCKPTQRIIWKRDNAENIIEAWERLKPFMSATMQQAAE
jgi:hypothetical protein